MWSPYEEVVVWVLFLLFATLLVKYFLLRGKLTKAETDLYTTVQSNTYHVELYVKQKLICDQLMMDKITLKRELSDVVQRLEILCNMGKENAD